MPADRSSRSVQFTPRLALLLLTAAVLIAYLPALRGGFVWDDDMYVVNNPTLRSLPGLRQIWAHALGLEKDTPGPDGTMPVDSTGSGATMLVKYIDYPLTLTSFWIEWQLWGLHPFPYHLANVLLHAVNAILLWLILQRLKVPGALGAAAIFALHPLHVESVAWIAERKTLLSTLFSFVAILAWLRFLTAPSRTDYVAVLLVGVLAMLSKISVVSLPVALLLLTWWRAPGRFGAAVWRLTPLLSAAVALMCATVWREHSGPSYVFAEEDRLLNAVLIAGRAAWFYVGKLLWPFPLIPIYPRWDIDPGSLSQYLFPIALLSTLVVLWWRLDRFGKGPLVAALVYLLAILPTLGFVRFDFLRFSYVADHFAYPATAALIALFTSAATSTSRWTSSGARSLAALVLCALLLILTTEQARTYESGLSFWAHNVQHNPASSVASLNLASQLFQRNRGAEAERVARAALAYAPSDALLHNILGAALGMQNDLAASEAEFRIALQLMPSFTDARLNLGLSLFRQQRWQEAIAQLELIPTHARRLTVERHLGLAFQNLGDARSARVHLQSALRINPADELSAQALQQLPPD